MKIQFTSALLMCFTFIHINSNAQLPKDENGWTIFTPSADTRIMYVSNSEGDDSTATYYAASDTNIAVNPFNPSPPNKNKINTTNKVVNDVTKVLDKV